MSERTQANSGSQTDDLTKLLSIMKGAQGRSDAIMRVWDHDITAVERALARIAELEANEKAYEEIIGKKTYREVADELAATPQSSPETETVPELKRVEMLVCTACLDGIGEECHTPGCSMFLHSVDLPFPKDTYREVTDFAPTLQQPYAVEYRIERDGHLYSHMHAGQPPEGARDVHWLYLADSSTDRGGRMMEAPSKVATLTRRYNDASRQADTHRKERNMWKATAEAEASIGADLAKKLEAALTSWEPIETRPELDKQPGRQFILIEGSREHSGAHWHRVYAGEAFIRKPGAEDEMLQYRRSDIMRLCADGDIDPWTAKVTHWMPARYPVLPTTSVTSPEHKP